MIAASSSAFAKQSAAKPLANPAMLLAGFAVQNSTALDGSALSLEPSKTGLTRLVILPDGSVSKTEFTLLRGKLGTVAEGDGQGDVVGMFVLGLNGLSVLYADGRSEVLALTADHKVSLLARSATGESLCLSWYPAGHRFTAQDRKAALARYARQLGLQDARYATPAADPDSCPADITPVNLAPAIQQSAAVSTDFDRFYVNFVAPHEGGFVANDGNGSAANFGINQGANPDIDVAGLAQPDAEQLLYQRYWLASGADQLPAALAMVHGDTAINMGVKAADELLAQSGGDAQIYLELREDKYRAIAAANPDKANYLSLWLARAEDLRALIGGDAGDSLGDSPRFLPPGAQPDAGDDP